LRQAGAPIDHNIVERALKESILNLKNALFYKTPEASESMPCNDRDTLARLATPAAV
jgi:hypothetical protein